MIDVVDVTLAAAELEHVLERIDQVLAAKRHNGFGDILVEFPVNAEAADAAEAIAVFVEEFFFEEGLGLVDLGRISGTKPGVDSQERIVVAFSRIVGQGVENQGVGDLGDDGDGFEAAGLNLVDGLAELCAGLDQLFAAFGIDDRTDGVIRGLKLADFHVFNGVELFDDRFGGAVLGIEGAKEGRRGDFAALVDADGQGVLFGDGAFDPASTFGNDAAAMQRTVAFLDLDQKIDAGGPVQLIDDDAFGAVDDEFTAADHDGDFTQVDRILDDLVLVLADESDLNAEGHSVGQTEGAALIGGVRGSERS